MTYSKRDTTATWAAETKKTETDGFLTLVLLTYMKLLYGCQPLYIGHIQLSTKIKESLMSKATERERAATTYPVVATSVGRVIQTSSEIL